MSRSGTQIMRTASSLEALRLEVANLQHELAQARERKRTAYEALWALTTYAGHLQLAAKAVCGSSNGKYLTQLASLVNRDLRWPLEPHE